ncbi:hypothetical protein [Dyella sp.]|uniref:hypothetical protein n=1 Tax=Dyella sp. TaxID=1869338 RepID=UPI003F7E053E
MHISSAVLLLPICAALFAASGSARAADGRIAFSGAVLEPTCAVDTSRLPESAPPESPTIRHGCGATADASGSTYVRNTVNVSTRERATDPLLGYFASYAPASQVVVQTYD